jgi:hypothetical protein
VAQMVHNRQLFDDSAARFGTPFFPFRVELSL